MRTSSILSLSAALVCAGVLAFADGHANKQLESAVKARNAQMQLYAFNLGTLGAMAKAEKPYDAESASAAAANLLALASMSQQGFWLPGSDNQSIESSRALPAIWAEGSDVGEKAGAFVEAAKALDAVAGTDLASLQGAMGAVGASCGSCHKAYRAPKN